MKLTLALAAAASLLLSGCLVRTRTGHRAQHSGAHPADHRHDHCHDRGGKHHKRVCHSHPHGPNHH